MVNAVRCLSGVDAAVEGDELVGQVGLGEDGRGEVGGLGWLAKPAGGHLPRSWAGSPGSILVPAASAGASALTVTPVAASREARKWVSCVQPGLGRHMMRADDAAGERGGPGVSQIRPEPRSRMEPAARWASRNGARRFTAGISSNWAVMSCSGWRWLSPSLLASTAHRPGPGASAAAWTS